MLKWCYKGTWVCWWWSWASSWSGKRSRPEPRVDSEAAVQLASASGSSCVGSACAASGGPYSCWVRGSCLKASSWYAMNYLHCKMCPVQRSTEQLPGNAACKLTPPVSESVKLWYLAHIIPDINETSILEHTNIEFELFWSWKHQYLSFLNVGTY